MSFHAGIYGYVEINASQKVDWRFSVQFMSDSRVQLCNVITSEPYKLLDTLTMIKLRSTKY